MKIYKTQKEVEADIVNGKLVINDSVTFECSIKILASISARNISALDISARDILAENISAGNIYAENISARDISAGDISAWNILAENISALDISALDISAGGICFYAICCAYVKFECKSIKGRRDNSKYFCLDSEVVIRKINNE